MHEMTFLVFVCVARIHGMVNVAKAAATSMPVKEMPHIVPSS